MRPPPPLPTQTVVAAQRVVTPSGVLAPGWLVLDSGVIQRIGSGVLPGRADQVCDGWLVPAPQQDGPDQPLGLVAGADASFCLLGWQWQVLARWENGQPVRPASGKTS